MKEEILELLDKINEELCRTYKQNLLCENNTKYNKCYSAIYLLQDIAETFSFYKTCKDETLSLGAKYLMIYGILESLFMQQNALNDLLNSLDFSNINYKNSYPEIFKIREIRNDIAGHPTNRDKNKTSYSTYLSRPDLSLNKIKYEESEKNLFVEFDINESILIQEKFIKEQLKIIYEKLVQEKIEHINKFKNDKLYKCFQEFLYAQSKIHSGQFYSQNDDLGFKLIEGILEKLKEKLSVRYANWEKTYLADDIKKVEKIKNFLISQLDILNETNEDNKFIKINLLENLFTHLKDLKDCCIKIDNEYENGFEFKKTTELPVMPAVKINFI